MNTSPLTSSNLGMDRLSCRRVRHVADRSWGKLRVFEEEEQKRSEEGPIDPGAFHRHE